MALRSPGAARTVPPACADGMAAAQGLKIRAWFDARACYDQATGTWRDARCAFLGPEPRPGFLRLKALQWGAGAPRVRRSARTASAWLRFAGASRMSLEHECSEDNATAGFLLDARGDAEGLLMVTLRNTGGSRIHEVFGSRGRDVNQQLRFEGEHGVFLYGKGGSCRGPIGDSSSAFHTLAVASRRGSTTVLWDGRLVCSVARPLRFDAGGFASWYDKLLLSADVREILHLEGPVLSEDALAAADAFARGSRLPRPPPLAVCLPPPEPAGRCPRRRHGPGAAPRPSLAPSPLPRPSPSHAAAPSPTCDPVTMPPARRHARGIRPSWVLEPGADTMRRDAPRIAWHLNADLAILGRRICRYRLAAPGGLWTAWLHPGHDDALIPALAADPVPPGSFAPAAQRAWAAFESVAHQVVFCNAACGELPATAPCSPGDAVLSDSLGSAVVRDVVGGDGMRCSIAAAPLGRGSREGGRAFQGVAHWPWELRLARPLGGRACEAPCRSGWRSGLPESPTDDGRPCALPMPGTEAAPVGALLRAPAGVPRIPGCMLAFARALQLSSASGVRFATLLATDSETAALVQAFASLQGPLTVALEAADGFTGGLRRAFQVLRGNPWASRLDAVLDTATPSEIRILAEELAASPQVVRARLVSELPDATCALVDAVGRAWYLRHVDITVADRCARRMSLTVAGHPSLADLSVTQPRCASDVDGTIALILQGASRSAVLRRITFDSRDVGHRGAAFAAVAAVASAPALQVRLALTAEGMAVVRAAKESQQIWATEAEPPVFPRCDGAGKPLPGP